MLDETQLWTSSLERSFRAATPRAALEAVKNALGADAIILETREVRSRGGAAEVEIVARPPAPSHHAEPPTTTSSHALSPLPLSRSARQLAPPSLVRTTQAEAPRAARASERFSGFSLAPPIAGIALDEALVERGVAENVARRVVERAGRIPGAESLRAALPSAMAELIQTAPPPWELLGALRRRRVIALAGPTGVGKTTTIAKTAARALLDGRLQVALITVDTWRIGAVDHIRRYGEIMGVPTYVARDQQTLSDAIERCADADLVLVDTAGRSPAEAETFLEQIELLQSIEDMEIHLAVAAGTSVRQLRTIRERYAAVPDLRLVVTKLDEADGPGSLLNVAAMVARPLACFTNGQRVPEDLHVLDIARFTEEVLAP